MLAFSQYFGLQNDFPLITCILKLENDFCTRIHSQRQHVITFFVFVREKFNDADSKNSDVCSNYYRILKVVAIHAIKACGEVEV